MASNALRNPQSPRQGPFQTTDAAKGSGKLVNPICPPKNGEPKADNPVLKTSRSKGKGK